MSNVDVLLIDDSPSDIVLMREAFKEAEVSNTLHAVMNGEDAIAFLNKEGPINPHGVTPGLILLDLNLPGISGQDVSKFVKSDERLHRTPVVMLTSSAEESDVARAYDLQANSYVVKPVEFDHLIEATKDIESFWLKTAQLPDPVDN